MFFFTLLTAKTVCARAFVELLPVLFCDLDSCFREYSLKGSEIASHAYSSKAQSDFVKFKTF
jgi:hypothetical protein